MKKTVLAVILTLLFQIISTRAIASYPPGGAIAGVALAIGLFGFGGSASKTQDQKVAQSEFSALNNNPQYVDLLNQSAGGELNTVDILK